jgi:hypothetical protein
VLNAESLEERFRALESTDKVELLLNEIKTRQLTNGQRSQ